MAVGFTPKHIVEFPLNELTQEQFLAIANEAAKKCEWDVGYFSHTGIIAYTNNGMFSRNAEIKIKIENGVATINSSSTGNEMVDWGKNKDNIETFLEIVNQLKTNIKPEELELKYEELKGAFVSQEEDILRLPPPTTTEKITGFFSIFKPTKGFFITPILLDLNIIIFIIMAIAGVNIFLPDNESLLSWGANFRPLTLEGQWWRLITNCFLHIGILHLVFNMYALLYIGVLLEPHLGRTRFLSAYMLTGITASVASLCWHDLTISAGASGAIFGMYGVFLAMLTTNLIEKSARKALLTSIAVFVGFNLMYGLKGGIDNAAHLGGLIGGLLIGYAYIPSLKRPDANNLKFITIGLSSIVILVSSFVIYEKIPNDIGKHDEKIKEFASYESTALEVYKLPENTPNSKILYSLKEKGIYNWDKCIKLFDEVEKLNLPEELHARDTKLKEYCELRKKVYELAYKAVSENTDQYKGQIEDYNKQIQAIIDELGGGKENNQ